MTGTKRSVLSVALGLLAAVAFLTMPAFQTEARADEEIGCCTTGGGTNGCWNSTTSTCQGLGECSTHGRCNRPLIECKWQEDSSCNLNGD